ncbi:MAG: NfeD family protein, partial [Acidobacteria bacterium]|nr:NfeD family protein [Acidobacteriota bacterium]
ATALSVALPFAAITIFLLRLVIRAQATKSVSGDIGMIGEIGKAETALTPEGKIFVHGELWDASSRVPVPAGAVVRILAVEGLKLWVEPVVVSHPAPMQLEDDPEASQRASKGA